MKSALFFDIDGTLWDYDHFIPDSTREAIRRLRENGHYTFICTGRARAFVNHPELISLGFDGFVCSCGCHVEIDGKMAFEHIMDTDKARETLELVRSYGIRPILEGPKHLYMDDSEFDENDFYGILLRNDLGDALKTIGGDQYGKWHINKMSCATEIPQDKLAECYSKLEKDYHIIVHNKDVCELVPRGFSKATGMLEACKAVGVDPANTYAFGDSENDLDMLKAAAVGIAMGNGTDNAKAAADYVTTPFFEDGIYNACKHFGLI